MTGGNCAFESVLLNVNHRDCFRESLPLSHEQYRRVWLTDFKNRHVNDNTWNIFTHKQWDEGWEQMMEPGVYEHEFFGDLMLYAIINYLLLAQPGLFLN